MDHGIDLNTFTHRYWERKPTKLRSSLFSSVEAFDALRAVAAGYEIHRSFSRAVRVFVDGGAQLADLELVLPKDSDRCAAAYVSRVMRTGAKSLGVVLNDASRWSSPLWFKARAFLSDLYDMVGVPSASADCVLFLGNYEATPFGVHKDDASVFCFVLEGRKRIRLWPLDVFDRPPFKKLHDRAILPRNNLRYVNVGLRESRNYSTKHSIVLEGEPGDVLYWPASYWHVGEGTGLVTSTLNVGVYLSPDQAFHSTLALVQQEIERRLGRRLSSGLVRLGRRQGLSPRAPMPKQFDLSLIALEHARYLKDATEDRWFRHVTSAALRSPAPTIEVSLRLRDHVVADQNNPIELIRRRGQLKIFANGHSLQVPTHPQVAALLSKLNRGKPVEVRKLIAANGHRRRPLPDRELIRVLRCLCRWQALRRV